MHFACELLCGGWQAGACCDLLPVTISGVYMLGRVGRVHAGAGGM